MPPRHICLCGEHRTIFDTNTTCHNAFSLHHMQLQTRRCQTVNISDCRPPVLHSPHHLVVYSDVRFNRGIEIARNAPANVIRGKKSAYICLFTRNLTPRHTPRVNWVQPQMCLRRHIHTSSIQIPLQNKALKTLNKRCHTT